MPEYVQDGLDTNLFPEDHPAAIASAPPYNQGGELLAALLNRGAPLLDCKEGLSASEGGGYPPNEKYSRSLNL